MQHENRIKSRHVKIRHVPAVARQRVHRVVDALEVVVVLSTVLEDLVGKDGVVGLGAQELVGAGAEPGRIFQSVRLSIILLRILPGGVGRHQLLDPVHPALTVRVRRADGVCVIHELRNQYEIHLFIRISTHRVIARDIRPHGQRMEFISIQRVVHLLLSFWRVDGDRRGHQRIRHRGIARPVPVGHSQSGGCSDVGVAVLVRIGGSNVLRVVPHDLLQVVS